MAQKQASDASKAAELDREVASLRTDLHTARVAASTDALTGAANRAAFQAELARLGDLAVAGVQGFALIFVDIDRFKSVNDSHGHSVGDRVLIALMGFLGEHVRRGDLIARWGGEEIAILMPAAHLRAAHGKARSMVKELADRRWAVNEELVIGFTISAGVAAWRPGDTPESLVERADGALYQAKHTGRNKAVKSA